MVRKARQVLQVTQVLLVLWAQQDHKDQLDHLDCQDWWVAQASLAPLGRRDSQVQQVSLGAPDRQPLLHLLGILELLASREL